MTFPSPAASVSFVVLEGHGPRRWLSDDLGFFKLTAEQGAGRMSVTEVIVYPGGGTPPHRHALEDETFFVRDGQVRFVQDDTIVDAAPGDFIFAPRGQIHQFSNVSEAPATLVLTVTPPTNFEAFGRECGVRWDGLQRPSAQMLQESIDRMLARSQEFGIDILPAHAPNRVRPPRRDFPTVNVLGDLTSLLLPSADNPSQHGVSVVNASPGGSPPPHVHHTMDEAFYILDGSIEFLANGVWTPLHTGDFAYSPPGATHTYRNRSTRPAKFLVYHTAGSLDAMFQALHQLPTPPTPTEITRICSQHDTILVTP
jgi:quercetin dioxygenase-like cupin family protein